MNGAASVAESAWRTGETPPVAAAVSRSGAIARSSFRVRLICSTRLSIAYTATCAATPARCLQASRMAPKRRAYMPLHQESGGVERTQSEALVKVMAAASTGDAQNEAACSL